MYLLILDYQVNLLLSKIVLKINSIDINDKTEEHMNQNTKEIIPKENEKISKNEILQKNLLPNHPENLVQKSEQKSCDAKLKTTTDYSCDKNSNELIEKQKSKIQGLLIDDYLE